MKPNALISQCRASFAYKKDDYSYRRDFTQDSFSVSGVHYEKSSGKYLQKAPLAHRTTKNVEFEIIFYKNQIFMIQDNEIYSHNVYQPEILRGANKQAGSQQDEGEWNLAGDSRKLLKKFKTYLSLEAANCVAHIEKLDSVENFQVFRRRTRVEVSHGYL